MADTSNEFKAAQHLAKALRDAEFNHAHFANVLLSNNGIRTEYETLKLILAILRAWAARKRYNFWTHNGQHSLADVAEELVKKFDSIPFRFM